MGLDLTAFDAVLKDDYRPVIISLLNKKTRLLDLFTKNTDVDQSDGRQKVYPIHTGRNEGVGSVSEGNNVPTAGNEETGQVKVPYKYTYGRIQLTAQTIKASKTSKGAFKSAMKLEMNNMVTNLAKLRNRQLWGHGVGILARSHRPDVRDPSPVGCGGRKFARLPGHVEVVLYFGYPAFQHEGDH